MYCKHFKGKDLYYKNIYEILQLNTKAEEIDFEKVTYSGDTVDYLSLTNLVVYKNVFQDKTFAREYSDLTKELSVERKVEFGQNHVVEPLTPEEIEIIKSSEYREEKIKIEEEKYNVTLRSTKKQFDYNKKV